MKIAVERNDQQTRRVVIIGGGVSGLAAAHRLRQLSAAHPGAAPLEITLLEASSRLGGIVRTTERDGFVLEGGPDSFISEKPEALTLVRELGFADRLIETNDAHRRSFIVRGGRLRPVPEGFQLLAPSVWRPFLWSDIFSWRGKARIACDLFLPRRRRGESTDDTNDDESLAAFVRRRLGREALERMAQPMVGGIYTADPELLSLKATMPRFLEMERAHRSLLLAMRRGRRKAATAETKNTSGPRYSLFLSFDRGMQILIDELTARLPGEMIELDAKVEAIARDQEAARWRVALRDRAPIDADAVCLALPAYQAAALLGRGDGDGRGAAALLTAELGSIPYASTATVNLAFRRDAIAHSLDGFGFVTPAIEGRATLACSFSSIKFANRAPAGHVLLRAFVGGALQPDVFDLDDERIVAAVLSDLRELLGVSRPPLFAHVERWPRSMAQYHVGHLSKVAAIAARAEALPGLTLAGNAYGGAGIPDCIRGGQRAAEKIFSSWN